MTMFFGCRHPNKDFIYLDEIKKAEEDNILQKLVVAYSRQEQKKVYVQDRIAELGPTLWQLVHKERATFYLCGGAAMGKSVREVLRKIIEKEGDLTAEKSSDYLKKLVNEGRYIAELWS